MPAVEKRRWTIEEVEHLIDKRDGLVPRYEVVNGELLVTPAPSERHQRIIRDLYVRLRAFVDPNRLGEVRLGPSEVRLDARSRFEPDIFVVPAVNGQRPPARGPVEHLLLAVEVLSPGSVRHDRITKRRVFQEHGVPEYWVVDGEAEAFEIWRPRDERSVLLDDRLTWRPEGAAESFLLDLPRFFAEIVDP